MTGRFCDNAWRIVCAMIVISAMSCEGEDGTRDIRVDLRTDLLSGMEFDSVRIQFGDGDLAESVDRINREADDFLRGQRVGSANVVPGTLPVTVTLYRSLEPVIARRVLAQIDAEITVATIVISRNCEGVACPNDDPALESCLGGRCVDPRCTLETPEFCPEPLCTADEACESVACADPRCSDGVCFSLPDDARCGGDERCDGILGCVPVNTVRDAGFDAPSLDAGADATLADSFVSDVGVDAAGMPDAGPDVFDAGVGMGAFGPAQLLTSLTLNATTADDPTLTPDLLQIFFKSQRPLSRVWTSRRSAIGEPFPPPTELTALFDDPATSPELSPDGLSIHLSGDDGGDFNIYRSTRANLNATFPPAILVPEVSTTQWEFAFAVNDDSTIVFFQRMGLQEARRTSSMMPWGTSNRVTELIRTGTEIDAHIIGDGLVVYFAGDDPSGGGRGTEIWRAERPSLDRPFDTAERIESVSSATQDTDPWVSADERVIVFMSRRDGRNQIYVATRDGGVF